MNYTDAQMIDWIEAHPDNAPHKGMDGRWHVTAHSNRETWGSGNTFRECMTQVLSATGYDKPDRK